MNFNAQEIADIIDGTVHGDSNAQVNSVAKIEEASVGSLCFLANNKYKKYIYTSNASIIIINNAFKIEKKSKSTLIKVKDAYSAFSQLLEFYNKTKYNQKGISKKADIHKDTTISKNVYIAQFTSVCKGAVIGENVKIYANCYIGENTKIEDNTIIFPNVTIYHECKIGKNNIIHSGVIIGADGFGFAQDKNKDNIKISQIGNVVTCDNVEIGANSTIDRATMGSTIIKSGVKLDNLIQIGHNVEVGENTVIAAQTCIAGSSKIGQNCMIGGQVAISGHLKIANNVKIAGQSGIASSINKKGSILQGPMAFNIKEFQRSYVIFKKLPDIYRTLNNIKKLFNV